MIYISVRACLCFHIHAIVVIAGVMVWCIMPESPHKDRSKVVCLLTGSQPQTLLLSGLSIYLSIRPFILQKHLLPVDQLICVLLGPAGRSGDGRSSTLTAACSETGWEQDSASLTETDRTRLFIFLH